MNRIEVKNVNKSFQGTPVLKQINLTLEEGKIYGLLGRNGAETTCSTSSTTGCSPTAAKSASMEETLWKTTGHKATFIS